MEDPADPEEIRYHSLKFIHLIHEATVNTHMHKKLLENICLALETGKVDVNYIHRPGPLFNALLVAVVNGAFYWTYFLLLNGANPIIPFQLDDHIYYHRFTLSQLRLLLFFGLPLSVVNEDLHYMCASIRKYVKLDHWSIECLLYLFFKKRLNTYELFL